MLGIAREHGLMVDRWASSIPERPDLVAYKRRFASISDARTLTDALHGADVLIGLSGGQTWWRLTKSKQWFPNGIIFCLL